VECYEMGHETRKVNSIRYNMARNKAKRMLHKVVKSTRIKCQNTLKIYHNISTCI
jgi:hypothetical protein